VQYRKREKETELRAFSSLALFVVFFLPPFVLPGAALLPVVRIKSIYKFKNLMVLLLLLVQPVPLGQV
jgi:hypothetical protein